jgi:hypothetical protein
MFCSCGNIDESIGVIAIIGLASIAGVCTSGTAGIMGTNTYEQIV